MVREGKLTFVLIKQKVWLDEVLIIIITKRFVTLVDMKKKHIEKYVIDVLYKLQHDKEYLKKNKKKMTI